ncbi:MAG: Endo-1,4-beta-xylanase Z precursor [Firmicutes bacterium ADurb.Bin193]|nr:MAG: Endo-1,4-beta-xylanase Z precursor [Firmicutes bacterium ADurb.Bin193]
MKNIGKRIFLFFLICLLPQLTFIPKNASADDVKTVVMYIGNPIMEIDGVRAEIDPGRQTVPIISEGRTLIPIRSLTEALGGTAEWNDKEQKVTIELSDTVIVLWIGKANATVNGKETVLDVSPVIMSERTMLPLRFIAENLGYKVEWEEQTGEITITKEQAPKPSASDTKRDWVVWKNELQGKLPKGIEHKTYYSELVNTEVGYSILLPPDYSLTSKSYPVIYWLHGIGGKETQSPRIFGKLSDYMEDKKVTEAVVVFVNGVNRSFYSDSFDGQVAVESTLIKELIPHIDSTYRTIKSREGRAIEGFSMGGYGALKLAFRYPDLFSSVQTYGGAFIDEQTFITRHADIYSDVFGGNKEYFDNNYLYNIVRQNAEKVRDRLSIGIACGGGDITLGNNNKMHALLNELKLAHKFEILDDLTHSAGLYYEKLGDSVFNIHFQSLNN